MDDDTLRIKLLMDIQEAKQRLAELNKASKLNIDTSNAASEIEQFADKSQQALKSLASEFQHLASAARLAVGAQGLGAIADVAGNLGYTQAQSAIKSAQSLAQGAIGGATAGMKFGPAGAGIGAILGASTTALQEWTRALNESKERIKEISKSNQDILKDFQRKMNSKHVLVTALLMHSIRQATTSRLCKNVFKKKEHVFKQQSNSKRAQLKANHMRQPQNVQEMQFRA